MVVFRTFKEGTMTILEKDSDKVEKGTTLKVYAPLIGRFGLSRPPFDESLHLTQWSSTSSCELSGFNNSTTQGETSIQTALVLNSSLHDQSNVSESFKLLGHDIHSGKSKWSFSHKLSGEIPYVDKYWEWVEDVLSRNNETLKTTRLYDAIFASLFSYDRHLNVMKAFFESWCASTNTLHTPCGELSISLWDLWKIGGLPFDGKFYDEVVPSAKELLSVRSNGKLCLPKDCRYLFLAYHRLSISCKGKPMVKISDWVNFWYKGQTKYEKPPKRRSRNKSHRPKETYNPSGIIPPTRPRSSLEEDVFTQLGVEEDLKEKTYVAAFLACWLCRFVLPADPANMIRPGVFKVASMMAYGEKFCLAIPVLASLYKGLNELVSSPDPGSLPITFPIHYVYGWLGEYFNTHFHSPSFHYAPWMTKYAGEGAAKQFDDHEAQDLFKSCDGIVMHRFSMRRATPLVDTGGLPFFDFEYLASIRSVYLSLRRGDCFIIEPYSPHRFSRQFGYHQDVPGRLKMDIRDGGLEEVAKYWWSSTQHKTMSTLHLPDRIILNNSSVTKAYVDWWRQVYSNPFMPEVRAPCRNKRQGSPKSRPATMKRSMIDQTDLGSASKHSLSTLPEPHNESDVGDGSNTLFGTPSYLPPSTRVRLIKNGENKVNSGDRNWKHRVADSDRNSSAGNTAYPYGGVNFFDGVPSSCSPIQAEKLRINDGDLMDGLEIECIEESSEGESVQGPSALDMAVKERRGLPIQVEVVSPGTNATPIITQSNLDIPFKLHDIQISTLEEIINDDVTRVTAAILLGNEQEIGHIQAHHQATPSIAATFDPTMIISEARRNTALALGRSLTSALARTPLDRVLSLEPKIQNIFDELSYLQVDFSPLHKRVVSYMKGVKDYLDVCSSYAKAMTVEGQVQKLADLDGRMADAFAMEDKDMKRIQSLETDLGDVEVRLTELAHEAERLKDRAGQLRASMEDIKAQMSQREVIIAGLKEERIAIEQTPIVSSEELNAPSTLKQMLKEDREEILDLAWLG